MFETAPSTPDIEIIAPARVFAARGVLEDHPRLDIRVLGIPPEVPEDFFVERRLAYGEDANWRVLVSLETYSWVLEARLFFHHGQVLTTQAVAIITKVIGGRRRHFFVCAVEQKTVEVLAYRDGMFASARAQGLVHRSQVGANRKRGSRTSRFKGQQV